MTTMIVPFASSQDPAALSRLPDLQLPHLQALLGRLQALEDHLRGAVATHRGNKAVTALRHVDDVALTVFAITQGPPERSDVHAQVDLLDHRRRPHQSDQLLLSDHSTGTLDQHLQNIQRATAHAQGPISIEYQPLAAAQESWVATGSGLDELVPDLLQATFRPVSETAPRG